MLLESRASDEGDTQMGFHSLLGVSTHIRTALIRFNFTPLWQWLPRRGMGKTNTNTEGGRLTRKAVWKKYGRTMHFLTLEFEEDSVEVSFRNDYLRRNKRLVEYGSFGIFLSAASVSLMYDVLAEPFLLIAPIFLMKWAFIVFCRDLAMRHFQTAINLCCLSALTAQILLITFGYPRVLDDWDREKGRYCIRGEGECAELGGKSEGWKRLEPTTGIMVFLVLIISVYRIRFHYFLQYVLYFLCLFESTSVLVSCMPYDMHGFRRKGILLDPEKDANLILQRVGDCPQHIPRASSTIFVSVLLCVLSYTLEVLQRKDFILASMVFKEHNRSEALLHNILPNSIVEKLKKKGISDIASYEACAYDEVTVLFADVVSFTTMSAMIDPTDLVALLNQMFTAFDEIAVANGVEKIKTIGDCYMAATGVPIAMKLHAKAMARFGLQMLQKVADGSLINPNSGEPIQVRVGMHSGACVAGVIGHKKFAYDIWGDAVNTASRMESHGKPMHLHCSAATRSLIHDDFQCEPREVMKVKGKGDMQTYFVTEEFPHAKNRVYRKQTPTSSVQTVELADALERAREQLPPEKMNDLLATFTNQIRRKLRPGKRLSLDEGMGSFSAAQVHFAVEQ